MSLLLAMLPALGAAADFNGRLEAFPIGFWNSVPIEVFDEAKVQEWKDAGMTLVMGPRYTATPESVEHMKRVLEWAAARDIKVIVCDSRARARNPLPEDFRSHVAQAVADFAGYDAAFGFFILDEPGTTMFPRACEAARIIKTTAPHWSPFVNLLPWYPGVDSRVGYDDWQTYLDDFVKQSGVDFLCYDCYSQMNPGQSGWPMYFRNLREYGEAARRHGIPFWTIILSVGHFQYRCPSEDDLRWQFNTAVAYGAQGILYYFFYMDEPRSNYRLSPIDEFWERTPTFDSLKRTNKRFLARFGRLFLDLTLDKAMQWPEPVSGCSAFEPDEVIRAVRAEGNRALIVSRFADRQGRPWVVMVNNSTEESAHATLTFAGGNTRVHTVNWQAREESAGATREEDCVAVSHWLAPGQMEVYRVEPAE